MSVNEKMTAIANAIRAKIGGTKKLGLDAMAAGVGEVYEKGKQDEHFSFWLTYQNAGHPMDYANHFYGTAWTDTIYKPIFEINGTGKNCLGAFAVSQITDTKVDIDVSRAKSVKQLFYKCEKLKRIHKLIVDKDTPELINAFAHCNALEHITISGVVRYSLDFHYSPNLSSTSVNNIIGHLKDLTGATSQTLTFHATVGNKLTQAQKDAISAKNWTLTY